MLHDLAGVVPDREIVVCGDQRLTAAEFDRRVAALAGFFRREGLAPGDKVAIALYNRPEYLETFFAALRLGCVPVNVNYRYVADELAGILENSDARVLVYEPDLEAQVGEAVASLPDGSAPIVLRTGAAYEAALEVGGAGPDPIDLREPEGDDLVFVYTGGTTGSPKGVMWRNDDLYRALWEMARPGTEPRDPVAAAAAGKRSGTCLPVCPLMHGTGLFIALSTLVGAGTLVLIDRPGLDPEGVWDTVALEGVQVLTIVGDVFARPLLAALDAEPDRWDLRRMKAITSSGVTWSPDTKRGLLRHMPGITLVDTLGASEGMMTRTESTSETAIEPARFTVSDRVKVFGADDGEVEPGSDAVGLVALRGFLPLGYYKDDTKTAATFRTIDGTRYSIPGDYASVDADGTIRLLGRGSACINTGGEKVYPEEIELMLRAHPAVLDCVVVGIPDDRFGEIVVALVQSRPGSDPTVAELDEHARARVAGYKRPRHYLLVESLDRSEAGKANYTRLRARAVALLAAEDPEPKDRA
ncbi:MAG: CoA synthetase, long-chain fatty acid:CoA ligase [Actinomycetia bacterium]|nr:CoA synthetase, long-chain fatty acid:CoA ligase [Actinomycetes bacterium]